MDIKETLTDLDERFKEPHHEPTDRMSDRQIELLEEAVKWLRLMGIQEARDVVNEALSYDDSEKEEAAKIAYQLSNGENTTSDIAEYIPFSYRWVSYRQTEWKKIGILDKSGPQEPYEHILSLDDLGIESPEIPEPEQKEE